MPYVYFNQFYIDTLKEKSPNLPEVTYSFAEGRYIPVTKSNLQNPSNKTRAFIESRLKWVSNFINLDFKQLPKNVEAAFHVSKVDSIDTSDNDSSSVVEVTPDPIQAELSAAGVYVGTTEGPNYVLSTQDINTRMSTYKWVWIHEIGHVLGLTHPNNIGNNTAVTNDTTVMSYARTSRNQYKTFFTDTDISNLQTLWGTKSDVDQVTGLKDGQWVYGTSDHDVVIGTSGGDIIYGGEGGADYLRGNGGSDIFVLQRRGKNKEGYADQIVDFDSDDKIGFYGDFKKSKIQVWKDGDTAMVLYGTKVLATVDNFIGRGSELMIETNPFELI